MKAIAVFPKTRTADLIVHPAPTISAPTDVKLRILEVGICGTDREICTFEYGTPPTGSDYLVIGHESLGEVVEIGSAVSRVKVGDLVVPMVRRPCAHAECVACRAGRQDFCYTGDFTERGIGGRHGFMTEFVVDDQQYMNVVPHTLRDVAILVEPLTIAEKALTQIFQVQKRLPWATPPEPGQARDHGHRAVVLGAGPVGLLGAMALRVAGLETYVYSREPAPNPKSQLVEAIGAHYVSSATDSVAQLAARVGNIDVVYEATGASGLSFEVMKVLGINGVFVFTGVPGRKAPIEVDTDLIMRDAVLKNQVIFGTVNAGRETFEDAIRDLGIFVQRWPQAVASLITGRFPIEAYRDLLFGQPTGIKNVIRP
ncbi:MAG: glucose 1-dehydrogenase [Deltaproteobacteria bacterium]|nr:glucose 1-dehydrogenase [Deltaproteobacteria bacterium]MBI3388181.1 glucose 1-dehydrogenase [Deltaproteobacteria bacterium]